MTDLHTCSYYCNRPECIKAQRDELRERLAQPEQKPVQDDLIPPDSLFVCGQMGANVTRVRLAEPVQEPVACKTLCELCVKRGYTFCANAVKTTPINTPPRREWVGLTEQEIEMACVPLGAAMLSFTEVARAIEAAHGIKENT